MPLALDEVLRDHWPDFARRYETRLAAAHHRAVRAVMSCRTPELGGHVWQCACHHHHTHYAYHSCNHRSCPQCGALDQQKWAAVQEARLLPGVPYFLVTLTIPDALRGLCKLEPAILYDLLLREAAGALKDLCSPNSAASPASPPCSTPGAAKCSTIPMCMSSSPPSCSTCAANCCASRPNRIS